MTQVFGYMRFSFIGRNDTRMARMIKDEEKRYRALYNPLRMKERFHFFENITLPSIRAQTVKDFKILIVSSPEMPDEYKKRLNAVTADIPQIEVIYSSAEHVTHELNPRVADMTAGNRENTVHFRLDDDDAICANMVELLAESALRARKNELVSFPRGLFLTMFDGQPHLLRKFEPYIAIAWAYVNRPGQIRSPYQGVHNNAHQYLPSTLDPRPLAYIHVSHEASDTRHKLSEKLQRAQEFDPNYRDEIERANIDKEIARYFPNFSVQSLEDIIASTPLTA